MLDYLLNSASWNSMILNCYPMAIILSAASFSKQLSANFTSSWKFQLIPCNLVFEGHQTEFLAIVETQPLVYNSYSLSLMKNVRRERAAFRANLITPPCRVFHTCYYCCRNKTNFFGEKLVREPISLFTVEIHWHIQFSRVYRAVCYFVEDVWKSAMYRKVAPQMGRTLCMAKSLANIFQL